MAACASLPHPTPNANIMAAADGAFAFAGRLSIRQGEKQHHVGIDWRHEAARDEIFLSGPLGQGLAELTHDAGGAQLMTADRQRIHAPDWESLAAQVFGVRLPLSGLPRRLIATASMTRFDVDGWQVDVLEVAAGRPALMELTRDDIAVRLKIDRWSP